jgi:hypothetical protein
MTDTADDPLRALADLLASVAGTLRGEDTPETRADAAAQVDRLRELVAHTDRTRPAGGRGAALFDLARVGDALRQFAEALRAPTTGNTAAAMQAITDLQSAMGLTPRPALRDDAAEREHYRLKARAAMDEHFRQHPLKPFKP